MFPNCQVLQVIAVTSVLLIAGCDTKTQTTAQKQIEDQIDNLTQPEQIIPTEIDAHVIKYSQVYVDRMLKLQDRLQQLETKKEIEEKKQVELEIAAQKQLQEELFGQNNAEIDDSKLSDSAKQSSKDSTDNTTTKIETTNIKTTSSETASSTNNITTALDKATALDITTVDASNVDNNRQVADVSKVANEQALLDEQLRKQQLRQEQAKKLEQDYIDAMEGLFVEGSLSARQINTFINMVTISPEVLDNEVITQQLMLENKSPALARLINQYHVWEEIEEQQRLEVQKLQQQRIDDNSKRQQELDSIMETFKEKIASYDKKIAEYKKQLQNMQ